MRDRTKQDLAISPTHRFRWRKHDPKTETVKSTLPHLHPRRPREDGAKIACTTSRGERSRKPKTERELRRACPLCCTPCASASRSYSKSKPSRSLFPERRGRNPHRTSITRRGCACVCPQRMIDSRRARPPSSTRLLPSSVCWPLVGSRSASRF